MPLPLSFPVFYYCAVKDNTNLAQYDAVSVLLLGKRRVDCTNAVISDADAANYISGKKRIRKTILAEVSCISETEAAERLQRLGFQDVTTITEALKRLADLCELSDDARKKLLDAEQNDEFAFAARMFLLAVRCPAKKLAPLGGYEKMRIASCYQSGRNEERLSENRAMTPEEIDRMLQGVEDETAQEKKKRGTGGLTPAEIDALLQTVSVEQHEPPKVDAAKLAKIRRNEPKPEIITRNIYIGDRSANAFLELTNIILSAGITALASMFEEMIRAGFPEFSYFLGFDILNRMRFSSENIRVLYEIFNADGPEDGPRSHVSFGYMVISMDRDFLKAFYEQQKDLYPARFVSYSESLEYESSLYREVGSIFSGACITALSDLLDRVRFEMEEANTTRLKERLEAKGPIFAGTLPFSIGGTSGCGFLILNSEASQTLLLSQKEFL